MKAPLALASVSCLGILLSLAGCATTKKEKPSFLDELKSNKVVRTKDDFRPAVMAAVSGDDLALKNVLSWSTAIEGEEAMGCARMLLKLRSAVGEERFVVALSSLPEAERLSVREKLQLATALSVSDTSSI